MEGKSQDIIILEHLRNKGSITSMEAINKYGITRLSAKIFNLRKMGFEIETKNLKTKNRYGNITYGKYVLIENNQ